MKPNETDSRAVEDISASVFITIIPANIATMLAAPMPLL